MKWDALYLCVQSWAWHLPLTHFYWPDSNQHQCTQCPWLPTAFLSSFKKEILQSVSSSLRASEPMRDLVRIVKHSLKRSREPQLNFQFPCFGSKIAYNIRAQIWRPVVAQIQLCSSYHLPCSWTIRHSQIVLLSVKTSSWQTPAMFIRQQTPWHSPRQPQTTHLMRT